MSTSDFLVGIFPGRRNEINQLLKLLGQPNDPVPPVFVYGPAATGKTSVVREAIRVLRRPHAYVSCRSCHNARFLFESILNQLLGHVRSASNNFASARKCETMIDFARYLPGACTQASSSEGAVYRRLRSIKKSFPKVAEKLSSETGSTTVYLILDHVELSRWWSDGTLIVGELFKLSELTRMPNLGLILISRVGLDGYQASTLCREPVSLYFCEYSNSELYRILLLQRPNVDLYALFLSAFLRTFCRVSRCATELSRSLEPLYRKYCEPIFRGLATIPDEQGKRQRYTMLQPYLRPALSQTLILNVFTTGLPWDIVDQSGRSGVRTKTTTRRNFSPGLNSQDLSYEMPECCKYLLLAAHIASRNPAALDTSLFDTEDVARGSSRKRRKSSLPSVTLKETVAHEQQTMGPGSFSLERLWAIFRCISDSNLPAHGSGQLHSTGQHHVISGESDVEDEGTGELSPEVLLQLSTLVSLNLLSRSSSNRLDGSTRYCSNVDGNAMQKIAKSVRFPLFNYLLHS